MLITGAAMIALDILLNIGGKAWLVVVSFHELLGTLSAIMPGERGVMTDIQDLQAQCGWHIKLIVER